MNDKNKFVTNSGWLTRYALACGYVEEQAEELLFNAGSLEGVSVRMELESVSSGVYCIRVHDHTNGVRLVWEYKATLKDARKFFVKQLKKHNLTRKLHHYRG